MHFLVFISTFIAMEGVTWCTHKFVMHGFLWNLHYDHHNKDKSKVLEKNDLFFIYFAIISMTLFYCGAYYPALHLCTYVGLGILGYGVAYFCVHEIIIHKRLLPNLKLNFFYFKALQKAHRMHHSHLNKEDGECFGMLFVPLKYFIEAKNA
jgi:beta-carotene 3-hydroxylase